VFPSNPSKEKRKGEGGRGNKIQTNSKD